MFIFDSKAPRKLQLNTIHTPTLKKLQELQNPSFTLNRYYQTYIFDDYIVSA